MTHRVDNQKGIYNSVTLDNFSLTGFSYCVGATPPTGDIPIFTVILWFTVFSVVRYMTARPNSEELRTIYPTEWCPQLR